MISKDLLPSPPLPPGSLLLARIGYVPTDRYIFEAFNNVPYSNSHDYFVLSPPLLKVSSRRPDMVPPSTSSPF